MKTLFNALVVLVFVLASNAAAQDKAAKTGAAAYDDFVEPWRTRFVKDWERQIESVKDSIATSKDRAGKARNTATNIRSGGVPANVKRARHRQEGGRGQEAVAGTGEE